MIRFSLLFSLFLFFQSVSHSDLKSSSGSINIDINNDGQREAVFNANGLNIGSNLPSSNLQIEGTFSLVPETLSSGTNLNANSNSTVLIVDTSSDNVTVQLPYAGNVLGRIYHFKKSSLLNTFYLGGGASYIDQHSVLEITDSTSDLLPHLSIISDGNHWHVTQSHGNINALASDNLVGWWRFDETTGTTAEDSSNQNNDGTLNNFTFSDNTVEGKVGNALSFGGGEYVQLGSGKPAVLQFSDQPFSLSVWVNVDFSSNFGRIIGADSGGGSAHGYALRDNGDTTGGNFGFYHAEGTGNGSISATAVTGWVHLAAVHDGSNNFLYVNGVLQSNNSPGSITPTWGSVPEISIGRRGSTNNYIGLIDDVKIYNKALSADEISIYYQSTR